MPPASVTCPKCAYVRTAADTNPAWQCPRCQVAYLKYRPGAAQLGARLVAGGGELAAEAKADHSVYALIAANLIALLIAFLTAMSLRELMFVYWIQSAIIGVTSFLRIASLNRFDPSGVAFNDQPIKETAADKYKTAFFFLVHYGLVHIGYFLIIKGESGVGSSGLAGGFGLCALAFAVNHFYSFFQNARRDELGRPRIGILMFLPYMRVVPMQITIFIGGVYFVESQAALIVFCTLNVAADVLMHSVEHRVLAKGSLLPPPS